MVDDRNHRSQRLIAILFKPIKNAKKRVEKLKYRVSKRVTVEMRSFSVVMLSYDSKATSTVPTSEQKSVHLCHISSSVASQG